MSQKIAFLTNARQFAGPGSVAALGQAGWTTFCHDDSFSSPEERIRFENEYPGSVASGQQSPEPFIEEGLSRFQHIDALISNDVPKGIPPLETLSDPLSHYEDLVDSVMLEPVRLLRAALPAMRKAGSGSIILVTSAVPLRNPAFIGPFGYNASRAGTNELVKCLASELAPTGIQVNAVAPFWLYSSTFFKSDIGPEDPKFLPLINEVVPMNRFGQQEEIGQLIHLLASGDAQFISGQVIAFSGAGA